MFSVTRSQAKAINPEDVSVGFKDVAGCDEAKVRGQPSAPALNRGVLGGPAGPELC